MRTINNSLNSVDADSADNFASVSYIVDETAAAAPIAEDNEGGLSDDNGGTTEGVNNIVDEVMFNVLSDSLSRSYNSVNKLIVQYCFEEENNKHAALIEWALDQLGHHN